jgi:hypothetical protein
MRKALFGVILVASSFAGGAVVNGPGLRWAQSMIMNRLGMEPEAGSGSESDKTTESLMNGIPPLAAEPSEASANRDKEKPREQDTSTSREKDASTPPAASLKLANQPEPAPLPEVKPDPAPLLPTDPPAPAPSSSGLDAAVSPTANKPAPASASVTSSESASAPLPGQGDWGEIRRSLQAAGVSRYGIEGEPGGRVRFQCVIPLAGRRAVGQHFEAEGDDELQAARAVLKRITLWRATEADGHEP